MIRINSLIMRCLVLLLSGVCLVGCNVSDANTVQDTESIVVVETPADSLRDAQVRKARHIAVLPPELYEQMAEQEERLQEHGIPNYRPIYVPGYYRAVYMDPASNKPAWRAMTCTHPDCSGQGHEGGPFVFPDVRAGLRIDEDGKLLGPPGSLGPCPACNRTDAIERYSPPNVIQRRGELESQLAGIRAERDRARRDKTSMPEMTTTPREIMEQISNLPVLYLVEE